MSMDWEDNIFEKVIVNDQVATRQVKTFQTEIIAKNTPIKEVTDFPCKLCGNRFILQRGGLTGAQATVARSNEEFRCSWTCLVHNMVSTVLASVVWNTDHKGAIQRWVANKENSAAELTQ